MKNFHDLFIEEMKELYAAENQCVNKLQDLSNSASSKKLKEVLKWHIEETKSQVKRLEKMAKEAKIDLANSSCDIMDGLWKEWDHLQTYDYEADVKDAAIVCFLQKIKHYEIASYGSLKSFAKQLKEQVVHDLIAESIKEEGDFDKKLTEIAEGTMFGGGINAKACKKCA